jgi:hypothetical protein
MAEQFNITPQFDLSGLPQYAENDKADVKSDAIYAPNDEFLCVKKEAVEPPLLLVNSFVGRIEVQS